MAEGTVSEIMEKGSDQGDLRLFRQWVLLDAPHFAIHYFDQHSCCMENTDRVGKARMDCAGEGELGNPELPDAAQALEFLRVDEFPSEHIDAFVLIKDDEAMNGIT